jgi:hypothetical protein
LGKGGVLMRPDRFNSAARRHAPTVAGNRG